MTTQGKIRKWGNGFGVLLPKSAIEAFENKEHSNITISIKKNSLHIKLVKDKKSESLRELIKKITPENRHKELDWGAQVGKEI